MIKIKFCKPSPFLANCKAEVNKYLSIYLLLFHTRRITLVTLVTVDNWTVDNRQLCKEHSWVVYWQIFR